MYVLRYLDIEDSIEIIYSVLLIISHSSQKEIRFLNALGDNLITAQRGDLCYGLVIEICR